MEDETTPTGDDFDLSAEDDQHSSEEETDTTVAESGDDDTEGDDDASTESEKESEDGDESESETKTDDKKTPAFDKDLDKWAEKRGYDKPENDRERKLLQDIRNGQRDFSKNAEAEKAAKKIADAAKTEPTKDDDEDPLVKRVNDLERQLVTQSDNQRIEAYVNAMASTDTPVTEGDVEAVASLLAKTKETDGDAAVKFLLKDIGRLVNLARLDSGTTGKTDTKDVEEKAAQKERERLAKKTHAAGPNRSAKTTTTAKQQSELDKIWADDSI